MIFAANAGQQNGDAHFTGRQRKSAKSRRAASGDAPRKHQRAGEEEAAHADVPDLMAQVHMKLSPQLEALDLEAATYCTLFPLTGSDIVKEMQNAGKFHSNMVENRPSVERGSPHTPHN